MYQEGYSPIHLAFNPIISVYLILTIKWFIADYLNAEKKKKKKKDDQGDDGALTTFPNE